MTVPTIITVRQLTLFRCAAEVTGHEIHRHHLPPIAKHVVREEPCTVPTSAQTLSVFFLLPGIPVPLPC